MPSSCVIKGCKNYDKRFKKEHGITYHRFPTESTRREIWCRIIRKQRQDPHFKLAKNTRICSAHFCETDFSTSSRGLKRLKDTAVPRYKITIEVPSKSDSDPTPAPTLTPQILSQDIKSEDPLFVDISDLNPIFDSPTVVYLKKKIERLQKVLKLQSSKVKALQIQNKRLMMKNKTLQDTNKALKQERLLMLEMEADFKETKVEKIEPEESYLNTDILNP